MQGHHGYAIIHDDHATIRIASGPQAMMEETLLEEVAHLIRHEVPIPIKEEHDSIFWSILGQVTMHYRGGE
jgi:hypothetical protein